MLRLRQAQLQQQMDDAREKLAHVEIRLRQIEREGKMSDIEILIKSVEPLTVAGAREVVAAPEQMRARCIALVKATCALIDAQHLKTDGVSFALYYASDTEGIDVEMAFAVEPSTPLTQQGQSSVHILPAATVAYAIYRGSYDDFGAVGEVHHALTRWIDEHGYRLAGPPREFYLRPPQGPQDRAGVMEIQYPVEKV
jgi:effector-binding domain-containing protein